jgi:hypothetical protein
LARQVFVGGITAGAADEAQILAPPHRRADARICCGARHFFTALTLDFRARL